MAPSDSSSALFTPARLGDVSISNRVLMAPMTRNRATPGGVPTPMMVDYYRQRAGAGLIITEATQVSQQGQGYFNTPGIYAPEHVDGWRPIVEAVHDAGGRVFLQLWHVGRVSHPDFQPGGALPVAPSAIAPEGRAYTPGRRKPYVTPRPLETSEVPGIAADYAHATRMAREAGFDGVEIHAANGYLIDQFLRSGTNRRTDAYGGGVTNRLRFMLGVTRAVVDAWSPRRVGIRLSPLNPYNSMSDANPRETFVAAAESLRPFGLAYLHVVETGGRGGDGVQPLTRELAAAFAGPVITNDGHTRASAEAAVRSGVATAVAFGVPFLANPDLPERLRLDAPLNTPDPTRFYGGDERGYTDYPTLDVAVAASN